MIVVVDASIAGAWLLPDEGSRKADALLQQVLGGDLAAHTPALWSYEVTNLLVMAHRRRRLNSAQLQDALELIALVPRETHSQDRTARCERMARLANRFRLSAYDAAYLELADHLHCPLVSLDRRLIEASIQLSLPAR